MKLSGVTLATGTSALAIAINYDHTLPVPKVRLDTCKEECDFDNIIILGTNRHRPDRSFHTIAQIHDDQVKPVKQVPENAFFKLNPCFLKEQKGPPSFSAYIEGMPHVD
ncbi:MAG: hypothetical protein HY094_05620 [Candidatus Melainabacteria bacterium]|nr:hypothetical protein [Candidatus Melainabacteria bacterium]